MKFMLLIHGDEQAMMRANSTNTLSPDFTAYNEALIKAGVMIAGDRLSPTTTATSVRIRDGKTEMLDGPYAETREQFGGYYLIEAADKEEALEWAAKCPAARAGTIEVRPVWPTNAR